MRSLCLCGAKKKTASIKKPPEQLKGSKVLTFEETTTSQWLYTELKDLVDKIVVCDPHRNKLLNDGPENDKIDASKLVQLLTVDLLKGEGKALKSLRKASEKG